MHDSARARVSPRSRSRSTTTWGRSRPSSLKTRPRSASRSARRELLDPPLGLRGRVAVRHEVQLDLARRAEDRGLRVLEAGVDGGGDLVHLALGHRGDAQDAPEHDARRRRPARAAAGAPAPRTSASSRREGRAAGRAGGPRPRAPGPAPCPARWGAPRPPRSRRPASRWWATSSARSGRTARAAPPRSPGRGGAARPVAAAAASRVRSSAVGPSPPVAITTSARESASRNADSRSARSSASVVARRDLDPGVEQPLGEPERVRLGAQRPEQLAADRQDLRLHGAGRPARRGGPPAAPGARRRRPRRRRP